MKRDLSYSLLSTCRLCSLIKELLLFSISSSNSAKSASSSWPSVSSRLRLNRLESLGSTSRAAREVILELLEEWGEDGRSIYTKQMLTFLACQNVASPRA